MEPILKSEDVISYLRINHPNWIYSYDSFIDVMKVLSLFPMGFLLRTFVYLKLKPESLMSKFLIDFFTITILGVFAKTVGHIFTLSNFYHFALCMFIVLNLKLLGIKSESMYPFIGMQHPFINSYRAVINLGTIISILAVDFPQVYPQVYHKRQVYGFSLMDTGVGSFIFSHAIVSVEARFGEHRQSRLQKIWKAIVSSYMLIFLGCIRFFVTWVTNYSVPEEEYGKHWNFFFTLAAVKILVTVIFCILPQKIVKQSWIIGCIAISIYQIQLSIWNFKSWIIEGDDNTGMFDGSFLNSNRPGIFSVLGYSSLYLFGVQVGQFIFQQRKTWNDYKNLFKVLALVVTVLSGLTQILNLLVIPPSRYMANITFVIWSVAHNTAMLALSLLVELWHALRSTTTNPQIPGQCLSCTKINIDINTVYEPNTKDKCACLIFSNQ